MNQINFFLIILIILFVSCINNKFVLQHIPQGELNVTDTINLTGCILLNKNDYVHQFYEDNKLIILDTTKFERNLRKISGKYSFIQPYDMKKNKLFFNFCEGNEEVAKNFIKNYKKRNGLIFVKNESFIVLLDKNGNTYITFACWRPYIILQEYILLAPKD